MAWCRQGEKPFSQPMVSLLTHICVTWVQHDSDYQALMGAPDNITVTTCITTTSSLLQGLIMNCPMLNHVYWKEYRYLTVYEIKFLTSDFSLNELTWLTGRPHSQIPQCTCPISHNAPFRTEMCTFLFWMVHCGIWDRCIVGFVRMVLRVIFKLI